MTFFQQQRGRGLPFLVIDGGAAFFGSPTKKAPSVSRERQSLTMARNILNHAARSSARGRRDLAGDGLEDPASR